MSDVLYTPSEWGKIFHSLRTDEALGAGSAGPGKSLVLLMDPMEQVALEHNRCLEAKHPYPLRWGDSSARIVHFRRTMPMLTHTMDRAARFFPRIDPDCSFDKQRHTYTFKSGLKYQFAHCAESNDHEGYQSSEYSGMYFDELVQFEEEQYHALRVRVRSSDPLLSKMLKVRAASNPFFRREAGSTTSVSDPHWVRKRFVDPAPKGGVVLKKVMRMRDGRDETVTRIYLPATLYDNPDPDFVKQYEVKLMDSPPHIRQAMLYGDWYVNPGSFYGDDWIREVHICAPFKIPGDWRIIRGMDWGYKSFGCIMWAAIDYDGNMIVFKEFMFRMLDARQVAERVREYEKAMGLWRNGSSGITGPADTQLWERRGETGKTKAQEFAEVGVGWTKADKRSRARNAQLFLTRLRDRRAMVPGIMFFETCETAVKTIPGIQADVNDPECPVDGGDDHAHDVVGYLCAYASHAGVGTSRDSVKDRAERAEDDEDKDLELSTGRGKLGYGNRVE